MAEAEVTILQPSGNKPENKSGHTDQSQTTGWKEVGLHRALEPAASEIFFIRISEPLALEITSLHILHKAGSDHSLL